MDVGDQAEDGLGLRGRDDRCFLAQHNERAKFLRQVGGIALGINFGIMYLFFAPYLAVGVIAYLWFRTSKSNARKELAKRTAFR